MPYKLIAPTPGRSAYWRVRGSEFGISIDRTTQRTSQREAAQILAQWREQAKRASVSAPVKKPPTFAEAALAYLKAGGEARFLKPLALHFGETPLTEIDQIAIDSAASAIYPGASAPTRNRQVYSPVSAILRRAGIALALKRPKGSQGKRRTAVLTTDEAFRLLSAADALSPRFGALLAFLLYCGPRLSEALRLDWGDVDLVARIALLRQTKNGEPLTVHLPPAVVAAFANIADRKGKVFRLTKSGRIYNLLGEAEKAAGLSLPPRTAFHVLRHTHATWRRLYSGADTAALVASGLWKSRTAAAVYEHLDASEESRKSDLLPVRKTK